MQFFDANGIEMDIQDPRFFMDDELFFIYNEATQDILDIYF